MTKNEHLLQRICKNENNTEALIKFIGLLLLNPISVLLLSSHIFTFTGIPSFIFYMALTYIGVFVAYIVTTCIIITPISQAYAINLYNRMSYSYEKMEAFEKIKLPR